LNAVLSPAAEVGANADHAMIKRQHCAWIDQIRSKNPTRLK
jgi:hypothetical protein